MILFVSIYIILDFALITEKRTANAAVFLLLSHLGLLSNFKTIFKTIFDNYIPMLTYFISDDMITTEVVYNYEEETFL